MPQDAELTIALWRYEVIGPLLSLPPERGALKRELIRLANRFHEHPVKGLVRVGRGTLEEWLYKYKHGRLEGLRPCSRRDRGQSRVIDDELAEAIEALALAQPLLDGPGILCEAKAQLPDRQRWPSLTTLYRFLRERGLDQRAAPLRRDHRAYAFDLAGDCWQADVMYGPELPTPAGRRRKTYLIAILDDATRLIAHAEFYYDQHLKAFKDCLKQALLKRSVPRRLYMDNGQIFRSRLIMTLAARLGIHIVHTRPYRPEGRAKLERWFRRVRRSFLSRVDLGRVEDLQALNRLLFAWVEGEYHQRPHRGLEGETPLDRWMRLSEGLRPLPRDVDIDQLFYEQTSRRVAKDGTFTVRSSTFEAGPRFIGQRIRIEYDPFDLRRVFIITAQGERLDAFPVDRSGNRRLRRNPPPEPQRTPKPPLKSLEQLASHLESQLPPQEDDHGDHD